MIDASRLKGRVDRVDYNVVVSLVPENSRVLDLGCADGELLLRLKEEKNCAVSGVEIDNESVRSAIEKGVCVLEADIDRTLTDYPDSSFDVVLLSQTIQVTHNPRFVLREMLRVGEVGIVSTPNFAHWRVRLQVALGGRMPMTEALPYEWHESPNIHPVTIKDFKRFCEQEEITVEREIFLGSGKSEINFLPNLRAQIAIWLLRKEGKDFTELHK